MNLTIEEQALHTTSQRFAEAQFGELDDHPCSPAEDTFLNVMSVLLASIPVVALIAFLVF